MSTTRKIVKYQLRDVIRSRWLAAYAAFFMVTTDALLRFSDTAAKAFLSMTNLVLFVIPLVSIVFGTVYLYNAREFTELLLAQPVTRRQMFAGLYLGLALPLAAGFLAGVGLPLAWHGMLGPDEAASIVTLLAAGLALTGVFLALAVMIAVRLNDRLRGLGAAIGLWLLLTVVYDGAVMVLAAVFADHPLERPLLAAMLLNPVDLARVTVLLRFDLAALMGYTGAIFQRFFGGTTGHIVSAAALAVWIAWPLWLGERAFRRKDF